MSLKNHLSSFFVLILSIAGSDEFVKNFDPGNDNVCRVVCENKMLFNMVKGFLTSLPENSAENFTNEECFIFCQGSISAISSLNKRQTAEVDLVAVKMDLRECKVSTEHYRRQVEMMEKMLRDHFSRLSEISAKMKTHEDTHPNEVTRIVDTKLMEVRGGGRDGEVLLKMRASVREAREEARDLSVEVKMLSERVRRSEERQEKQVFEMRVEKERVERAVEGLRESEKDLEFEVRSLKSVAEDLRKKTEALEASSSKMESFSEVVRTVAVVLAACCLVFYTNSAIRKPPRFLQRIRKLPNPIQATSDTEDENGRSSRRRLNLS